MRSLMMMHAVLLLGDCQGAAPRSPSPCVPCETCQNFGNIVRHSFAFASTCVHRHLFLAMLLNSSARHSVSLRPCHDLVHCGGSFPAVKPECCMPNSYSQAAVTLRRMGTYLEYGRVPPQLQAPLVHALLGTLHIRCASSATGSSHISHSLNLPVAGWPSA